MNPRARIESAIYRRAVAHYEQAAVNYMMNAAYNRRAIECGLVEPPNFDAILILHDQMANSDGTATGFMYRTAMQYYGRPDQKPQLTAPETAE